MANINEFSLNDISQQLLIINKITIEKLFEQSNQNALILYLFYYKTAKWQNTTTIKANDEYCKKCLHWGADKLQSAKKVLISMKLIEILKKNDENGRIVGWFVRINYYTNSTTPVSTIPVTPVLVEQNTNTINNNNKCLNNNINAIKGKFIPPTLEDIEQYCKERNNGVDAKKFYDYYSVNDWKDNKGNQVKNWKQKMIANWEGKVNKETPKKPYSEIVNGQLIWHYN